MIVADGHPMSSTPGLSTDGSARPTPDSAILYVAHQWMPSIAQRFARLRKEVAGRADCFLLLQDDKGQVTQAWTAFLQAINAPEALMPFSPDVVLDQLGYGCFNRANVMLGCTHFPLLCFGRSSLYRFYWMIESDVEYRGHWGSFFDATCKSTASLLATHVQSHEESPHWHWWASLFPPPQADSAHGWPRSRLRKAFLPIYRLSADAIRVIDEAHREGWRGHFEVLIPTVLNLHERAILDLRAVCACYLGGSQEPSPDLRQLASMRWRPVVSLEEFVWRGSEPVLFHPVKQDWWFDGIKVIRYARKGSRPA